MVYKVVDSLQNLEGLTFWEYSFLRAGNRVANLRKQVQRAASELSKGGVEK